ncbi:hypothetical protein ACRE_068030 [Hapsidospora chrysogenum ATCC 11550]|uniref:PLD phosphodiesterase domain-containing protein n=1 Tax=Hapsidospora chrysogenum (strain ATCC 11550 / CBS 779.69 / DSM 880 / IAM 14645 / JCM 23072 / IMI 49137) TaxID=857340 RepID=A0A086SZC6_HAPC1|nr:hypothetical protein ACRE_068030 [Hapsidospora chrysogenum ATCC 11550]
MSAAAEFPESFVGPWMDRLRTHAHRQVDDFPSYHASHPEVLITTSVPRALYVGTGVSIFTRAILPAILNAKHSVHFVTCYWAPSQTLDNLAEALEKLAESRLQTPDAPPLKITIGFSSRSLLQKLLHTSSRHGHVYPSFEWPKLGLPNESVLTNARIDMTVKSLFFTPFSVMHPKYLVVDGARAWVPSCNVSWERWFEGCVEVEGDVVRQLLTFHDSVWDGQGSADSPFGVTNPLPAAMPTTSRSNKRASLHSGGLGMSATQSLKFSAAQPVPTIFLPSSHHRNPHFSLFPFLSQSNPPMTPLNAALLTLFENAQSNISIVTPNVTSWPVLEALLAALARGVDVEIRTSRSMMVLEQLVTACTTTAWCLDRFISKYKAQVNAKPKLNDPEAPSIGTGRLDILYYKPLESRLAEDDEPVLSHFKMTMVDDEYLVLGSGNMDRASWWTSQEIGILFYVPDFEGRQLWEGVLERRAEYVFRSADLY